jgi:phage gpG-like protein
MFDLSTMGLSELADRLGALPDGLRIALAEKAESMAAALYAQVVDDNLDGGLLNARSGALRASIQVDVQVQDSGVDAEIFSNGDTPYAAILEFGGKTSAHEILPDKARALSFLMNGKRVFARRIQHPGSNFAPRFYLRSALDDQVDTITNGLRAAVEDVAAGLGESS